MERGAEGQNRTADTAVFSRVLYRLSYLGAAIILGLAPSRVKAPICLGELLTRYHDRLRLSPAQARYADGQTDQRDAG